MNIKQIKQELATRLQVKEVTASNLFNLANNNNQLLKAIQISAEESVNGLNLRTIESWQLILDNLHIEYKGFFFNPKKQYVYYMEGNKPIQIGSCKIENFKQAINEGWFNILSQSVDTLECPLPVTDEVEIKPEVTTIDNQVTVEENNVTITGYVLVHDQADEIYIDEFNYLNTKRLGDVTEEELLAAYLVNVDAYLALINKHSLTNYQIVKVNHSSIRSDVKEYFRSRVKVNGAYVHLLPLKEATEQGYYYKGIPVEHFNNNNDLIYSVYDLSATDDNNFTIVFDKCTKEVVTHVGQNTGTLHSNYSDALKLAKQWLSASTTKAESIEANITTDINQASEVITEPLQTSFSIEVEVEKLKHLSPDQYFALIDKVQDTGTFFNNYYIPKSEVVEQYLTPDELVFWKCAEKAKNATPEFLQKIVDIQEAYSIVGREWEKRKINFPTSTNDVTSDPWQDNNTVSNDPVITEVKVTSTDSVTCTCNHPQIEVKEMFATVKTEITSLEVEKLDNTATELVNLSDVYFIELRSKNNRLYISRGLNIQSLSGKKYRINDALVSLENGSNFIKLIDRREKNRVILVNKLMVKKLVNKNDCLVIHWKGLITYPGVYNYSEWTITE